MDAAQDRRWRVWLSVPGPDARYRSANASLTGSTVATLRQVLHHAIGEIDRLSSVRLLATYQDELLEGGPIQLVVKANERSSWAEFRMTSPTGFNFSVRQSIADLRQWVAELDRVSAIGAELEASLEDLSPRPPRSEHGGVGHLRDLHRRSQLATLPDPDSTTWKARQDHLADVSSRFRASEVVLQYAMWDDENIPLDKAILERRGYSEADRTRPADAPGPHKATFCHRFPPRNQPTQT